MSKDTHEADVAFIKALAELLRENDLTELQVKREYGDDDSLNVRVSRALPQAAPIAVSAPAAAVKRKSATPPAGASTHTRISLSASERCTHCCTSYCWTERKGKGVLCLKQRGAAP